MRAGELMGFLLFFLFFPLCAYAADADIIVTEIAAYESSDHEWIELYNKGTESVDLTGWKFVEDGTNHGLAAFRGGMVLASHAYAVIADVAANTAADYPAYAGMLIDSSWTTLNESGELIGLKNNTGTIIEQFVYVQAPDHSLERVDNATQDSTSANWKEHSSGNTIGAPYVPPAQILPVLSAPQALSQQQSSQTPVQPQKPGRGSVVINELIADPSDEEKEWIELYNVSPQALDLAGWTITNGSGRSMPVGGMLQAVGANKYAVIETSGGLLKNLGDKITLLDAEKKIIDSVSYGNWDDGSIGDNAPRAVNPHALARKSDGYNTFINNNDFALTATATKGSANVITAEQAFAQQAQEKEQKRGSIMVSELFSNPSSHNPKDEFIELYNDGANDIDLMGWRFADEEGAEFVIQKLTTQQTLLKSKGYYAIGRDQSGIALNNAGGETIKLYEPGSIRATTSLHYAESAPSDMSYARDVFGRYVWTKKATPNAENIIIIPNRPPTLSIECPQKAIAGEIVEFDATDTFDPDNDALRMSWDFGDGAKSEGMYVSHAFFHEGTVHVTVTASDGIYEESIVRKLTVISLQKKESQPQQMQQVQQAQQPSPQKEEVSYQLILNELYPNPVGADTEEFIEIKNIGTASVDIAGIAFAVGKDTKKFVVSGHEILSPNALKIFSRKDASFSLTNTYDQVTLFSPSSTKLDSIDYDDAPSGMSYARTTRGDWLWTKHASGGKENNVDSIYNEANEEKFFSQEIDESADATQTAGKEYVKCTIVVRPGVFSAKKAFCADPAIALRLDMEKPPDLREGDRVSIVGKLSNQKGQAVLTVKDSTQIDILSSGEEITPQEKEIGELSDADLTSLIHVRGTVSRMQWPSLFVKSDDDELRAYVYKTTGIEKPQVVVGSSIELIGILDASSSGYRLLPRSKEDIAIISNKQPATNTSMSELQKNAKESSKGGYVIATLAALAIVSGGLIMQHVASKK